VSDITTFLAANTGLNLQTADLFSADALAQCNWPADTDQKQLLQQLRTRQRILKVYPDENVAAALEGLGFHSAHHIASLPADDFAQKAVPALSGITGISDPAALCKTIAGNAASIRRSTFELALAQPRTMELEAVATPAPDSKPDFQEGIPDYRRLFGPMITCDCDECQSIFGPAAYFTDLMRVVTNYITQPKEDYFKLDFRRPDLWTLPLDCNTATTEVSYLDIVLSVLKQNLQTNFTAGSDPMFNLASAVYPFNAPYNEPLETIRTGLREMDSGLAAIYKLMEATAPGAASAMLHLSPEQLTLVTGASNKALWQQYGLYAAPTDNYASLSEQLVFLKQTGLKPDQLERMVFQNLKQGNDGYAMYDNGSEDIWTTTISDNTLCGTITIECWIYPQSTNHPTCILGKNETNEFYIFLDSSMRVNCQYGTAAGTKTFYSNKSVILNAWTHIAWVRDITTGENKIFINGVKDKTYNDSQNNPAIVSDSVIGFGYISPLDYSSSFHGALSEIRLWTTARSGDQIRAMMFTRLKDYTATGLYAYWPLNETSGTIANDLGPHQYNASRGTAIDFRIFDTLPFGSITEINPTLMHGFYLNGVVPAGQYITLTGSSYDATTKKIIPAYLKITDGTANNNSNLSTAALSQLAVYIRMQAQTGWAFEELDWVLKSVAGTQVTINNTVIENLGIVKALQEQFAVPLDELTALWYDLKTYGRGNGTDPDDLWDRVYNSPPLMADSENTGQGIYYRPQYAGNPVFSSTLLSWAFKSPVNVQDQRLSNQLAAALGISGTDLGTLVNSITTQTALSLSVENMSLLYRIARFAKLVRMPLPDFISLTQHAGMSLSINSSRWTLQQVERLCEYAAWIKKTRLSSSQLSYLLTGTYPAGTVAPSVSDAFDRSMDAMVKSAAQVVVTPSSFVSGSVNAATAQAIYDELVAAQVLTAGGLVTNFMTINTANITNILYNGAVSGPALFKINPARQVISFSASTGDTVMFPFDPFADPLIQSSNSFTISLWAQMKSISTGGWPLLVGNRTVWDNNATAPQIVLSQTKNEALPGQVQFSEGYNNHFYCGSAPGVFKADETWAFISWVNDNGNWRVYCNGIETAQGRMPQNVPGVYLQTDNPAYYAASSFTGCQANLSIWNIARTGEEIMADMFTDFTGSEAGLIAFWPMNDGTGTTVTNYSGGGAAYNGTFQGKTQWITVTNLPSEKIVSAVTAVLTTASATQTNLVIRSLAAAAGTAEETMGGICMLSSKEVDNRSAFTNPAGAITYTPNMLLNADSATNPQRTTYLNVVKYNSALTRWFKLTGAEISNTILYAEKFFPLTNPPQNTPVPLSFGHFLFSLGMLKQLSDYKSLQALCNESNGLIGYFAAATASASVLQPSGTQLQLLAQLTGWNEQELNAITTMSCFAHINFNTIAGVRKIADVMAAGEQLNMGVAGLNMLGRVAAYNAASPGNWQAYKDTAAAVTGALTVIKGNDAVNKLRGEINNRQQPVLCNWLSWELQQTISGVSNTEELYEYLLIDVNMSPDVKSSWTVTAMNSLQLYVNRIINNLEPGAVNNIPKVWWKWMSTYREWQANREVYLYPENYVDPTLRKFQSDAFRQLINDLSKNQVTDENVRTAMANYLETVSDVASLQLVDACMADLPDSIPGMNPDNQRRVINMIGRSQTSPAVFYNRTAMFVTSKTAVNGDHIDPADATSVDFGPWEKIGLSINSDYISTVTAFGRQFIFWVEQSQITNTNGISTGTTTQTISTDESSSSKSDSKKYTATYCTIYYSWRDFNSSWIEPSVLKKDILIAVTGDGTSGIDYYPGCLYGAQMVNADSSIRYPYYRDKSWNKVTVLPLSENSGIGEALVVMLGPYVTCDPTVASVPKLPKQKKQNDLSYQLQVQLYTAAKFSYNNKTRYTAVLPATLLTSSFTTRDYALLADTTGASFVEAALVKENHAHGLLFDVTSSLLNMELPAAYSWWPCTLTDNYVVDGSVYDVISGKTGTLTGHIGWKNNMLPTLPGVTVPNPGVPNNQAGYINFPWSSNKKQKHSSFSFWINLQAGVPAGTTIFTSPFQNTGVNCLLGMTYEAIPGSSPQTYGFYAYSTINNNSGHASKVGTSAVVANTWYYITITASKTEVEIYLNGQAQRTRTDNLTFSGASGENLTFTGFNGYIFGLQYHRVTLTPAEALVLYQQANGYLYLSGLHESLTSFNRISNSAGAFVFNTNTQAYLAIPDSLNNTETDCIHASASYNTLELSYKKSPLVSAALPKMRFVRVNTDTVAQMITVLARTGFDGLYAPAMQQLGEKSLHKYNPTTYTELPETDLMDFAGAFGVYFWEIFFYAPYLVAEQLRSSNKFDAAEKWYQRIFNPTALQPTAGEEWYDFILDPENENRPVAYWPINNSTTSSPAITFPSLTSDDAAFNLTALNVSSAPGDDLPFAFLDRTIWSFKSTTNASSASTGVYNGALSTDTFTVTAWVKLTAPPSASAVGSSIVTSEDGSGGFSLLFTHYSEKSWKLKLMIWASLDGAQHSWVTARSYELNTLNEWQFVAGRYDGKKVDVYINGKKVTQDTGTVTDYITNKTNPFKVGYGNNGSAITYVFNGAIADVAYFNYAKKSSAIKKMYQSYVTVGPNAAFWNFLPFRRINATSLYHILNGDSWKESFLQPAAYYTATMQMAVYEYDPFDPDTIARLRVNSWQKATFMRYIDNLIGWGDALFTQDTWETRSDATMRYVLAETLLGRKPLKTVVEEPQATVNYNSIVQEYGAANVPQFLIEMENGLSDFGSDGPTLPQQVQSIIDAYYCIPSNKQLLNYWQIVSDRLFKLRHGLTITGAPDVIPLFAAPIDPRSLINAGNANSSSGLTASAQAPVVPWFRFSYLINQAKSVTGEVVRLGNELLSALEKKDAEYLSQLQAGYQQVIYNMSNQVKAAQINQLQYVGQGLQESYKNAKYMHNTYLAWMIDPVGPLEALSLLMAADSAVAYAIATGASLLAVPAYLLPDIFGLADGGMSPGDSAKTAASIIEADAHLATSASQMLQQMSQYVRRELEWDLQKNIAGNQMKEIQAQITANNFALEAARGEAAINQTQLEQAQEVYHFLKTKFTSEELYTWMSGQLSTLYFQMFQLAWSLAQSAQTALQYELNLSQSYLNSAAWNASYQGLISGDALSLALQQMENAYISGNSRSLEIRKTWSMRQNNPQALLTLISTGNCRFDIDAMSYTLDFPGHYNRKIKSLSVTIPAVVGPYQNIHASLTQTGNVIAMSPNIAAVEYMLGITTNAPTDGSLRANWNPNQEIIISTGVNDAGMFQVNFNDEQYLPFEGTGAVSSWSLSIPQASNAFDLHSISDVIITIEYTADDGGSAYAAQVTQLDPVKKYNGWQYLSMRQVFGAAWFNFCTNPSEGKYTLAFELVKQMYPPNLSNVKLGNSQGETGVFLVTAAGTELPGLKLQMNDYLPPETWPQDNNLLYINSTKKQTAVPGKGNPWTLNATSVPSDILTDGKIDQTKLLDIILVMPFSGTLTW
jgi:hypothetical protein